MKKFKKSPLLAIENKLLKAGATIKDVINWENTFSQNLEDVIDQIRDVSNRLPLEFTNKQYENCEDELKKLIKIAIDNYDFSGYGIFGQSEGDYSRMSKDCWQVDTGNRFDTLKEAKQYINSFSFKDRIECFGNTVIEHIVNNDVVGVVYINTENGELKFSRVDSNFDCEMCK